MDTTLDPNNKPFVSDASVSVEIETEDMTLNIGPQHPSTHGVPVSYTHLTLPTICSV